MNLQANVERNTRFFTLLRSTFGTVSGRGLNSGRVAVRNVTGYRALSTFCLLHGATVSALPVRYPALVTVTLESLFAGSHPAEPIVRTTSNGDYDGTLDYNGTLDEV